MRKKTPDELALQARFTGRLEFILQQYYQFRMQVIFTDGKKCTFYGHEQECTYLQCLHGHVPHINLNRLKGYTALLDYIEKTKRGKITKAVIYQREPGSDSFNKLCRRYFKGEQEGDWQDPILTGAENLTLKYQVINDRVVIIPPTESTAAPLPDFKAEIEKAFTKK
jgi:hypothetical protein